jgi:hypothetical protein
MNGSMGNMAFGAPETPASEAILNLTTVKRMLPLVQGIVKDIMAHQLSLERLQPEQERLDRRKRNLDWPQRQRRYQLQEQLDQLYKQLLSNQEELLELGVVLLDPTEGRVGFPTLVNNRRAYFSWHVGEEGLNSWHFAEESNRRPIPAAWLKEISLAKN